LKFGETREETGERRCGFFLSGWSWSKFSIGILKIWSKMNQTKHCREENEDEKLW